MADPRKVRWSQLKVGVLGLGAFLILAVLIFLLTSTKGFFQKTALLHTFMDDASGMAEGTPVRLNGFTIGTLDKIQLTRSTEKNRSEASSRIPSRRLALRSQTRRIPSTVQDKERGPGA